VAEDGVCKNV